MVLLPSTSVKNLNRGVVDTFRKSAEQVLTKSKVKGSTEQAVKELRNMPEEIAERVVSASDAEINKMAKMKTSFMSTSPRKGSNNKGPSTHTCSVPGYDADTASFCKVIVLFEMYITGSYKALYVTLRMVHLRVTGKDEKRSLAGVTDGNSNVSAESLDKIAVYVSSDDSSTDDDLSSRTKARGKPPSARAKVPKLTPIEFLSSDSEEEDDVTAGSKRPVKKSATKSDGDDTDDDVTPTTRKAGKAKAKANASDDEHGGPAPAPVVKRKRAGRR